ncbi:MAG: hypothetical protein HOI95_22910, partial [Chromatiales bacterium]|nr:hypothetical protein [Chromatiales bacterium]
MSEKTQWLAAAVIGLVLIAVGFGGSLDNEFLFWDDRSYLHNNPYLHSINATTLWWMLTDSVGPVAHYNWQPLTALSHAIDLQLWGFDAGMHRLGNLLLHFVGGLAVFFIATRVLRYATDHSQLALAPAHVPLAGLLTMALFVVHPLRVESVVWIAERKDVLCGAFYLLAVAAWVYARIHGSVRWRILSLIFALLAAMAKPMAVSLPFTLLALEHWPFARYRLRMVDVGAMIRTLASKLDYICVAAFTSAMALMAQDRGNALVRLDSLDITTRVLNAAHSLWFYLGKWLVPTKLSPLYAFPDSVMAHGAVAWLGLAAALAVAL